MKQRADDGARRTACLFRRGVILGAIVDQAARTPHLRHHLVAGIDAQRTGDAADLRPLTNVDAGGADGDALVAIDAIAKGVGLRQRFFQAPPLLPAPIFIGDHQRLFIEHRGLDARPGAHIDAHLFAHEAAQNEGRGGQDSNRCIGNRRSGPAPELLLQRRRVGEIEYPRPPGAKGDEQPYAPFGDPPGDLARAPGRLVQSDLGIAVAVDEALDMLVEVGPHRLRAGIAAPGAPDRGSDQEQADPGHDQQASDIIEFMRPNLDREHVEATMGEIDQYGLIGCIRAAIPAQPGRYPVDGERDRHDHPFQATVKAVDRLGINALALGVEGQGSGGHGRRT